MHDPYCACLRYCSNTLLLLFMTAIYFQHCTH